MGALAELGDSEPATGIAIGEGRTFVEWWRNVADDDDRALLRQWIDTPPRHAGHRTYSEVAVALTAAGLCISETTIYKGVHALRRSNEWAS